MAKQWTQEEIEKAYLELDIAHGYTDEHGVLHAPNEAEIERLTALVASMDGGPY